MGEEETDETVSSHGQVLSACAWCQGQPGGLKEGGVATRQSLEEPGML
jgi:hypothetical protein